MAKRGTLYHPKTLHLARLLKVEPWAALGLLEALWHWAGRYAPTGDLSSADPRAMAEGMLVRRCPTRVLAFLTESSWIDRVGEKLYIHDWPDHADDATKKLLQRSGRTFAPYYATVSRSKSPTKSRQSPDRVPTESRLPEPLPEPIPEPEPEPEPSAAGQPLPGDFLEPYPETDPEFEMFWHLFVMSGKALNERDKRKAAARWVMIAPEDRERVIRWAAAEMQSTWRDADHTPQPCNALESEGWTRSAGLRVILARDKKMDAAAEILARRLAKEAT